MSQKVTTTCDICGTSTTGLRGGELVFSTIPQFINPLLKSDSYGDQVILRDVCCSCAEKLADLVTDFVLDNMKK